MECASSKARRMRKPPNTRPCTLRCCGWHVKVFSSEVSSMSSCWGSAGLGRQVGRQARIETGICEAAWSDAACLQDGPMSAPPNCNAHRSAAAGCAGAQVCKGCPPLQACGCCRGPAVRVRWRLLAPASAGRSAFRFAAASRLSAQSSPSGEQAADRCGGGAGQQ